MYTHLNTTQQNFDSEMENPIPAWLHNSLVLAPSINLGYQTRLTFPTLHSHGQKLENKKNKIKKRKINKSPKMVKRKRRK